MSSAASLTTGLSIADRLPVRQWARKPSTPTWGRLSGVSRHRIDAPNQTCLADAAGIHILVLPHLRLLVSKVAVEGIKIDKVGAFIIQLNDDRAGPT